jgi:hypothetical protein
MPLNINKLNNLIVILKIDRTLSIIKKVSKTISSEKNPAIT